jgi:S-DNA-T family DNA segregation ATPase FtsK/SpoIIIE
MIKPIRIVLSPTRSRPLNVFLGLVMLLVATLLFLSLATYHATDPSFDTASGAAGPQAVHNWVGVFGAGLSDLMLQWLGVTAFLLPIWIAGVGWTWMRSRPVGSAWLRLMGTILTLLFVPALLALTPWHWRWLHVLPVEGVFGRLVAGLLVGYINRQGAWLVAGVLGMAGVYFASAMSLWAIKETIEARWLQVVSWSDRWHNWREERAEQKAERHEESRALFEEDAEPELELAPAPEPRRHGIFSWFRRKEREDESGLYPIDDIPAYQRASFAADEPEAASAAAARRTSIWERSAPEPARFVAEAETTTASAAAWSAENVTSMPAAMPIAARAEEEVAAREPGAMHEPAAPRVMQFRPAAFDFEQTVAPARPAMEEIAIHDRGDADLRTATVAPKSVSGFKLPSSTLLNPGEGPAAVREDELREEARVLVEKCGEFDVRGQVVQINPGPMVTTYEFKPEAGVKYSRVTGLADDLCLAMRAESILIERMAGKSTVGIQVPNHIRETIHLRDVLESETFAKAKSRLTLAMGKDINGRIVTADLAVMPHVLIAGSTGSGKSVAINAMIMSLLFRTTPSQVRLILVDPKRVELGMYEGVPHLFTPIITEPKLAANALRNAVREMERRLKLLASRSVRNIDQYNKLFEGSMPSLFDDGEENEPLPFIVIIIDELADLMMLDRANVEESITRLAQMARAVGIHLILATQRPSVDVITGLIKANVPTRMSFRLATKVDSRTILDTNGAEALLGRGDMLFLPPGTSRLQRLHAPYVSEKETAAVVKFWKEQGEAEYVHGFLESPKDERPDTEGTSAEGDDDPMFDDAVRLVFEFGKASTSLLQRRLRIGYGRAAHLIDLMERDGLVGAADGSRPRELLKAPKWLHEVTAVNE